MKIGDPANTPREGTGWREGAGSGRERGSAAPRAGASAELLTPGRLFQGRVVSSEPGGRVVLDVAGQRIDARSTLPLTPGREFWFEVRQGGGEPQLVTADKQGVMYRLLQQAAGGMGELGRLPELKSLLAAFGGALPQGVGAGGGQGVGELLARLALGSAPAPEKIAQLISWLRPVDGASSPLSAQGSLPGQLMALSEFLRSLPPEQVNRELLSMVARVGGMMEAFTSLNEQPSAPNQSPFWLIPCFFAMDSGAGSWLLSRDDGAEEGSEEKGSISFFLEMSRLGELQLHLKRKGERLKGEFLLADTRAAKYLSGRLGELHSRLEELGFQAELSCRKGGEPLLPSLKNALEKAAGTNCRKLIDIKA